MDQETKQAIKVLGLYAGITALTSAILTVTFVAWLVGANMQQIVDNVQQNITATTTASIKEQLNNVRIECGQERKENSIIIHLGNEQYYCVIK